MDEQPEPEPRPPGGARPVARFVPDRRYTGFAAAGLAGALLAVVVTSDAGGRLLAAAAAVVLAAYVICDRVFSPRVIASDAGITVHSPLVRGHWSWDQIEAVRPDTRIRLGLRNTTLEIDAGATLVVLSRRALGADPAEAAEIITAFCPPLFRRPS